MSHILWTDQPLSTQDVASAPRDGERLWERAIFPVGNGRLGCTAFGDPRCERIQFNQDSLWVGNEDNTGAYQPFGDVYVELSHDEFNNYRRQLDIDRAVQTISYESHGATFKRELFASRPAELIVVRFSASRPGQLTGKVTMGNIHNVPVTIDDRALVMRGSTGQLWYWKFLLDNPDRLIANRQFASDKNIDLGFEARVKVLHSGGSVTVEGDGISFAHCDTITLLLSADTNYLADRAKGWRGVDPHDEVVSRITKAEERSFDELLADHVADHQRFFHRLKLDLGSSPADVSALPTAARQKAYAEQKIAGEQPVDRELEALLYQYARYLMIACSSPHPRTLPANLQGLWLIKRQPSWRCDFHTDVNIQMNYWFVDGANLSDCFLPLPQWVNSIREVRKEETRRVLGVERGWLMRSENGIFGGSTWYIQKGDSAWLCQNLYDHYTYTQDREYLAQLAYPVMKEISEFWLDHLKELPGGTLVAPQGRSPEHGPVDVDGVTYDQALCWDLFNNTIEASQILGTDEDLRKTLIEKRDRLLGPKVGKWGQLQEWMEDIDDPACDHRHLSHMIGVYPGRQIHPATTPEVAAAARVGVTARRDHGEGHPAWSRVWKACLFARLGDAESAYQELSRTLATHIYGNLFAVHPPFQIDANFGFAAGVNEMLVQSHLKAPDGSTLVHLLPALPKGWASGSVAGLCARNNLEIDMTWHEGRLVRATLHNRADAPRSFIVRAGARGEREITLQASQSVTIDG